MALDLKKFAAIARATNTLYMYVTTDTMATVVGSGYFNSTELSGSVKVGDVILVNASDKLGFLKVTAVVVASGAITIDSALVEESDT